MTYEKWSEYKDKFLDWWDLDAQPAKISDDREFQMEYVNFRNKYGHPGEYLYAGEKYNEDGWKDHVLFWYLPTDLRNILKS